MEKSSEELEPLKQSWNDEFTGSHYSGFLERGFYLIKSKGADSSIVDDFSHTGGDRTEYQIQFRIPLEASEENLTKALGVLKNFYQNPPKEILLPVEASEENRTETLEIEEEVDQTPAKEILLPVEAKIVNPFDESFAQNWNPYSGAMDTNQRGKELCFYVGKGSGSAEDYKEFMLHMLKALKDGGVKIIQFLSHRVDERIENTPITWCATITLKTEDNKPVTLDRDANENIVNFQEMFNGFKNPLLDINISPEELKAKGIDFNPVHSNSKDHIQNRHSTVQTLEIALQKALKTYSPNLIMNSESDIKGYKNEFNANLEKLKKYTKSSSTYILTLFKEYVKNSKGDYKSLNNILKNFINELEWIENQTNFKLLIVNSPVKLDTEDKSDLNALKDHFNNTLKPRTNISEAFLRTKHPNLVARVRANINYINAIGQYIQDEERFKNFTAVCKKDEERFKNFTAVCKILSYAAVSCIVGHATTNAILTYMQNAPLQDLASHWGTVAGIGAGITAIAGFAAVKFSNRELGKVAPLDAIPLVLALGSVAYLAYDMCTAETVMDPIVSYVEFAAVSAVIIGQVWNLISTKLKENAEQQPSVAGKDQNPSTYLCLVRGPAQIPFLDPMNESWEVEVCKIFN